MTGRAPVLGLVTIGQTPRPDFEHVFRRHAGEATIRLLGALDGLTSDNVRRLADPADAYPLLVRLASGESIELPMRVIVPRVEACAAQLARDGARLVVVLCAGAFPDFDCACPLLLPGRLVPNVVASFARTRRVGVVTPIRGQVAAAAAKWRGDGFDAVVTWASPLARGEIEAAARAMADASLECVVLDCMGHDDDYRREFAQRCGRPVVAAQSIVARVTGELVS
jgi:protein AroM